MNHKSSQSIIVLSLLFVVLLSLVLVWSLPFEEKVSAEDIQSCLGSLSEEDSVREQAYKLATILFDDPAQRNRFADEVTEIYLGSKNIDFLLIYNTGGFGGGAMAEDPEWPSILEGIKVELEGLGYKSMIIEHQRGEKGITSFINEVDEILDNYPSKAPELAAKVAFLTRYDPELKVITTGRCFGAIISNQAVKLEAANSQVYSIQAGRPFWYTDPGGERTLVMDNNGIIIPDTLTKGGFWTFLWNFVGANLGQLPSTSPIEGGSVRIINWYFKMPGHTYTWEHPGVRSQVIAFLEENFASN